MNELIHKKKYWILLFLVSFNFFSFIYIPIPINFSKVIICIIGFIGLFYAVKRKIPAKTGFIISFIFLILSCLSSYFYRNQNIINTFFASYIIVGFLWYFYFYKCKLQINVAEQTIAWLAIVYSISYIIQYSIYPTLLFDLPTEYYTNLKNSRLRIDGSILGSLGYFFFLCKGLTTQKKRINFIFAFICFLVIFLMGFRTMILSSIIATFFMIIYIYKISTKSIYVLLCLFIASLIIINTDYGQVIIEGMIARQQSDNFSNEDYVRYIGLNYYVNEHFNTTIEMLLGSCMPYHNSPIEKLNAILEETGIRWNDWGIMGLSFNVGIITIGAIIIVLIKMMIKRIDKKYIYLNCWLLYILLCSILTAEFIRHGHTLIIALVLYMISILPKQIKIKSR